MALKRNDKKKQLKIFLMAITLFFEKKKNDIHRIEFFDNIKCIFSFELKAELFELIGITHEFNGEGVRRRWLKGYPSHL